jgi:plasmid stability protein
MKNVTISLDDDTHRRARIRAAELGKSLSGLVRDLLETLDRAGDRREEIMPSGITRTEFERLAASERELRKTITGFSGKDLLSRDELHDRARERKEWHEARERQS